MTWQAFFKLAGRNDELLEPQPIPPFIAQSDDDWMKLSPFAVQYWVCLIGNPNSVDSLEDELEMCQTQKLVHSNACSFLVTHLCVYTLIVTQN